MCEFYLQFKNAGEHLTVKTVKKYNDLKYFTRITFNQRYAIKKRLIRLEVPASTDLEFIEMNLENFEISKTEENDAGSGMRVIEYSISNMPSVIKLENLPGYSCTYPHLLALFKAYEISGKRVSLIEDTDDLYSWLKSLITESELSPELAELTDRITQTAGSDTAKIASIYYWVQDNIRYLAFEDGTAAFVPENPNNVYKYKYGDCKGMANLAKSMLKHAGFDARLCWIYTGNTCYSRSIPSIAVDNHMICAVYLNNSYIFLDPTVNYSPLFEINEGIQGKEGMVENGNRYIICQIPATSYGDNLLMIKNEIVLRDDKLIVDGHMSLKGATKKMFQYFLNHLPSDNQEDLVDFFVTKTDNNFLINDIVTTPADSLTNQFNISYNLEISNAVLDIGDEVLLTLDFYNEYRDEKIDTTRRFNFAFDNRKLNRHEISFNIPDNMIVESIPDSLYIEDPKFIITGSYSVEDSLLVYRKNIAIKNNILTVDEFDTWNSAVDRLIKFYNEMVVLKKQ